MERGKVIHGSGGTTDQEARLEKGLDYLLQSVMLIPGSNVEALARPAAKTLEAVRQQLNYKGEHNGN